MNQTTATVSTVLLMATYFTSISAYHFGTEAKADGSNKMVFRRHSENVYQVNTSQNHITKTFIKNWRQLRRCLDPHCHIKPRLHDTTCCQTGLTAGCIV